MICWQRTGSVQGKEGKDLLKIIPVIVCTDTNANANVSCCEVGARAQCSHGIAPAQWYALLIQIQKSL